MSKIKLVRNGRSFNLTIEEIEPRLMRHICADKGFSMDCVENAIKVRRMLPYAEDAKAPLIDAEKLWKQLGKPHKRFRDWADYNIKPMMNNAIGLAEISAKVETTKGRPKNVYMVSRDVAAKLAMMANTEEGNAVREYFLLMERIAVAVAIFAQTRANDLTNMDNELTHTLHRVAPQGLDKWSRKDWITANECRFKSKLAEVVSGHSAGEWRDVHGSHKGIRDVVSLNDLNIYGEAYRAALTLLDAFGTVEKAIDGIRRKFTNKVNADAYLMTTMEAEAA